MGHPVLSPQPQDSELGRKASKSCLHSALQPTRSLTLCGSGTHSETTTGLSPFLLHHPEQFRVIFSTEVWGRGRGCRTAGQRSGQCYCPQERAASHTHVPREVTIQANALKRHICVNITYRKACRSSLVLPKMVIETCYLPSNGGFADTWCQRSYSIIMFSINMHNHKVL